MLLPSKCLLVEFFVLPVMLLPSKCCLMRAHEVGGSVALQMLAGRVFCVVGDVVAHQMLISIPPVMLLASF